MKKLSNIEIFLQIFAVIAVCGFLEECVYLGTIMATVKEPEPEVKRAYLRSTTYTPEYNQMIQEIAQEKGAFPWNVKVTTRDEYSVKAQEADGFVTAGEREVEVYYISIDGVEEVIYSEDQFLTSNDIFGMTADDIQHPTNVSVAGYTGDEITENYKKWMEYVREYGSIDDNFWTTY